MTKARRSSRPVIAGIALALLAGFCAAPTITAWGQQPASGRANRLIDSANPYLLQHARNPVDWYPWGPEAIARAKGENKPIFLSVGYSTCYWCHVAERTVYANPAIAALMNEWFVNVKVDREERPDIDDTYMAARRQLTGSGGWPNNVFLTPDLKPFFAAGHIPPEGEGGKPGFARVIRLIHERWDKSQSQLQAIASQTHAALVGQRASGEAAASALPAPAEWLAKAREQILRRRDVLSGGIDTGSGARFPLPPLLELLLTDYRRNGTPESLQAVAEALGAMAFGGIHDHLAGGIHRYSTEPTWSVPHFEKMLYDNAQLLGLYADLYAITRRPLARAMGADIARYLSRRMMAPEGGFFTAENADIDGKEGATYLWTRAEILGAIGPAEENRFFAVYDLAPMPTSIAGRGVLRVRMDRGSTAKDQTEIERELAALAPLRAKLLKVRDRRAQPDRDDKIIVGLNGLAIEALARAGKLLAEPQWIDWARRSAELLWQHAFEERTGRLRRHIYKGEVRGEGFLEDYALLGRGLLALGEANGDPIWPARARALAGAIVDRFVRPDGAVVTTTDVETLIVPAVDQRDQYAPSGTSAAYALLARLGRTEPRYAEAARKILARMAPRIEAAPDRWASFTASAALLADAVPPPLASTHDSATRVKATASAQRQGDGGEIVVTLAIEPGYHLNANPASFDYLVPTRVIVAGVAGAHIVYPPGKPFKPRFVTDDLSVYEGSVTIRIELTTKEIGAMPVSSVAVEVQACDLQTCLEPATIVVPLAK